MILGTVQGNTQSSQALVLEHVGVLLCEKHCVNRS